MRNKLILACITLGLFTAMGCKTPYCLRQSKTCTITLERTACYGTCPIYTFTLNNDGTATYTGKKFVERIGDYSTSVPQASVDSLFSSLDTLNWMKYDSTYGSNYSDLPSSIITWSGRKGKRVVITGKGPKELFDLVRRLELLANRQNWSNASID